MRTKLTIITKIFFLLGLSIGSIFILTLIFIKFEENHYEKKFEQTKIQTSITKLKSEWGVPDDEFILENYNFDKRVLKYKRGILGWNTYVFLFEKNDTVLVSKSIDD
jgi:hypothetical protein